MEYKFVVIEKDGVKELVPVNQSFYKDFKTGDIVLLKKENKLIGLTKEMIKGFDKDVSVYFEDSRRRHGLFVILDKGQKGMTHSCSIFISDTCSTQTLIDYLPDLFKKLKFVAHPFRSGKVKYEKYKLTKDGFSTEIVNE